MFITVEELAKMITFERSKKTYITKKLRKVTKMINKQRSFVGDPKCHCKYAKYMVERHCPMFIASKCLYRS